MNSSVLLPSQVAVLCGGLGTRLLPLTADRPKPMVEVAGRPFLEHLLEQFAEQGITRFVLMTGHLSEQIADHFDDGASRGWRIQYSDGPAWWETTRRLHEALPLLDERFLLVYSDNFAPVDLPALAERHRANDTAITVTLKSKHQGNIGLGPDGLVALYDPDREADGLDHVEIGYMMVERDRAKPLWAAVQGQPDINFSQVLRQAAVAGELGGYVPGGPYFSVSDPSRLEVTRNALGARKVLLIDRDGTINRSVGRGQYVSTWEEFEFREDTVEAMETLASEGYSFIVITNQAGIALGLVDPMEVDRIHEHMVVELAGRGIPVLDVYVCPDHWDSGSKRRKPAPGMFFEAAIDHALLLDRVLYIGDDIRDCQAAVAAGCGMVFLADEAMSHDLPVSRHHQSVHSSLLGALDAIRALHP
ncbi:MAG: hypothetical protein CMM55_17420 [Rhodospirillaceae bacterium]|nr:hypothetical protein [Rhodospirillaceae bacterium]